jgi:hypothetical protein
MALDGHLLTELLEVIKIELTSLAVAVLTKICQASLIGS